MNIRTSKPGAGNKFYITRGKGGYSQCIVGSPTDSQCNVLANCVGYACGRFNEIIGSMKYPYLNCNAENFIERAKSAGLEISSVPTLGGIMVWQKGATLSGNDGAGHVAVVERIDSANQIYTSESGYGSSAFWNSIRTNSNGRWGLGSGYTFRGCIVNPAIGKVTAGSSTPTPAPSGSTTYKVVKGDCLSAIGAKFGVNWKDIASANGIVSPYTIYVGQVLTIPGKSNPTPTPAPSTGLIAVGTSVTLKQGAPLYNSSSDANPTGYAKAKTTTITRNNGSKHPYNTTGDYGWMDASGFTVNGSSSSAPSIGVGSKVRVKNGARTYTGGRLASFVYKKVYNVIQVNGDRVVIGIGNAVTAAVNKNDLYLA